MIFSILPARPSAPWRQNNPGCIWSIWFISLIEVNIFLIQLSVDHKTKTFRSQLSQSAEDEEEEEEEEGEVTTDEEGDERLESGVGILEFSPDKAGRDVTPANYDFREREKRHSGTLSSIAGEDQSFQLWTEKQSRSPIVCR